MCLEAFFRRAGLLPGAPAPRPQPPAARGQLAAPAVNPPIPPPLQPASALTSHFTKSSFTVASDERHFPFGMAFPSAWLPLIFHHCTKFYVCFTRCLQKRFNKDTHESVPQHRTIPHRPAFVPIATALPRAGNAPPAASASPRLRRLPAPPASASSACPSRSSPAPSSLVLTAARASTAHRFAMCHPAARCDDVGAGQLKQNVGGRLRKPCRRGRHQRVHAPGERRQVAWFLAGAIFLRVMSRADPEGEAKMYPNRARKKLAIELGLQSTFTHQWS